jgi:tetratricopeptide (TPR) repeat protein
MSARPAIPLLMACALLCAPCIRAEVGAPTRAFLAQAPKDVKELFRRARAAYDRAEFDDAAALGEAILKLGKEHPKVLCLIARCRMKKGDAEVARSLVQRALEVKPGDAEATALERELGGASGAEPAASRTPTTLMERLFGAVTTTAKEAHDAYYRDQLEEALERVNTALASDPADPGALWVRSLIRRDRLEREQALEGVEFLKGRFPKAAFLEYLIDHQPDPVKERAFYQSVEKDADPDPIALALLCSYKRAVLQSGAARKALERAVKGVAKPDRETLLAIADAALAVGDLDDAEKALGEYKALFGEDGTWLLAASSLRMHQGKPEEALRIGTDGYRKAPQRLAKLGLVISYFERAGKEEELLEFLGFVHQAFPDEKDILGKVANTAQLLVRKLSMKGYIDDIFYLRVQEGLPMPVVARVLQTFKEAHRKVGAIFDHFPQRVRLVIFDQIIGMPGALAYFNPMDDTIYVGAIQYQVEKPADELRARTVSEHEFTHYVDAELQRKRGRARIHRRVGWLSEGLAEWASDGLKWRLAEEGDFVRAAMLAGTTPLDELERPATHRDVLKSWYLQGHMMVKYLVEREPDRPKQLDRLFGFAIDLTVGADIEEGLKKHFGIGLAEFEKGFADVIRKEAAKAREAKEASPAPPPDKKRKR